MLKFLFFFLDLITSIVLVYFFIINTCYLFFMVLSICGIYHYRKMTSYVGFKEIFQIPLIKPISIISPAYNEENTIVESVRSLLSLEYPLYEVIVVNDGSKDGTLEKLIRTFNLKKSRWVFRKAVETKPVRGIYISPSNQNLIVVDKVNGKKADALNAGLNVAHYPLFCAIDSDSVLEKDALLKVVRPFLETPEATVGAGGIIRLSNGCTVKSGQVTRIQMPKNYLARFQIIEYFRAFLGGRMGLSMIKSGLIISGAFGLFRKDVALKCGGYRTDTVGEDMDLVVRMHKYLYEKKRKFRFYFIPDPICWTEAPESMKVLVRQRNRWHRGLIESLTYSKEMLFNPRYGITGLFAVPFFFLFEMLGPLIEVTGYTAFIIYLVTGQINYPFAWMFLLLAVFYGTLLSLLAILIEEFSSHRYPRLSDVLIIALYSVLENFFFRQYLAMVRAKAFLDYYVFGKKEWGEMKRKGFVREAKGS